MKIFLQGGAGFVGFNLMALLQQNHPGWDLIVLDKQEAAIAVGRMLFPRMTFLQEDLCETSGAQCPPLLAGSDACVMLQTEIGNTDPSTFARNNMATTELVLAELRRAAVPRLVHISSSMVNAVATDLYTTPKRQQEELGRDHWQGVVVERPTLMFGWFDRKHLGWLARFLRKSPVFPIPCTGHFCRQPLYVLDFCRIIERCLAQPQLCGVYDITGLEQVSYTL